MLVSALIYIKNPGKKLIDEIIEYYLRNQNTLSAKEIKGLSKFARFLSNEIHSKDNARDECSRISDNDNVNSDYLKWLRNVYESGKFDSTKIMGEVVKYILR